MCKYTVASIASIFPGIEICNTDQEDLYYIYNEKLSNIKHQRQVLAEGYGCRWGGGAVGIPDHD